MDPWTSNASYVHSGARMRMLVVEIDTWITVQSGGKTREGTYQLKRRRLLPDVRDPPEQGDEEVDIDRKFLDSNLLE